MRKFLTITTAVVALAAAGQAYASEHGEGGMCGNAPKAQWMSKDAIKAKIAAQGYEVRRVKSEGGCMEVYAIDKNGARAELRVNPASGVIVSTEDHDG